MSLSTHVLDTTHGCPAAGVALVLERDGEMLFEGATDGDGRCPALKGLGFPAGRYTLHFAVADYFRARGIVLPEPPFLDRVRIDFGLADEGAHYHVPLLVSPFGYSTYRGS
ncbi:hydroxyisourate hydrolase [Sphingomonas sp.]|uniref:hydroxyisourate hydrolase n=1 Tax=Sphingomonas sp. TaxID=28214 RepID=UPI000DB6903D|nr:hydroxyisourate hydrolase [Sphingomonas sp.]PZU11688.1 MAG: hydroxyisourate hydrolase [Sphingomonas sp.]